MKQHHTYKERLEAYARACRYREFVMRVRCKVNKFKVNHIEELVDRWKTAGKKLQNFSLFSHENLLLSNHPVFSRPFEGRKLEEKKVQS